ncbi:MAG TPA: tetratricopeptide repeat protein [Deltaproteobacteria bacterium]|nr:tetratricopeptide repeat protein [Deltaproteobacteria bacterium]HPR56134.1 tetratricopeptide repeat protein [Deltaproteobacteria bacterium]HXK48324.1 tetratricopeptide repeat protein [Deltaproteobacteria bacterium]
MEQTLGKHDGSAFALALGWWIFLLLLACTAAAYAQDTTFQERYQAAQEQMQGGNYPFAYQILTDLFREDPANADVNFSLGRAAFETGRYEEAVMAFERVLLARPDAMRVKLETARCYYKLGALDTAEGYFREVLAAGPPEQVKKNIGVYLDAIEASRREHFFQGAVSSGVEWDDNVNVAPSSSLITISTDLGDLPVRVDKPAGDTISHLYSDLRYAYVPYGGNLGFKASLLGYQALYTHEDDLDVGLAELRAGPSLRTGGAAWDLYGMASHISLDSETYSLSYGGGVSMSVMPGWNLAVDADARLRKKDYADEDAKDALNASLAVTPAWASGPNRIRTSLGVEREDARSDEETYWRATGSVSFERLLPFGLAFVAGYRYQGSWYAEEAGLFGEKRQDDVHYYNAALSLPVFRSTGGAFEFTMGAGYTYTDSNSTLPLYTYAKNVTSLSLNCTF